MTVNVKKILLRYYPPGLLLQYVRDATEARTTSIDLLDLTPEDDPSVRVHSFTLLGSINCAELGI